MVDPTSSTLRAILPLLNRARLPYVLIGGLASGVLGRPRTTLDIDILVAGGPRGLSRTAAVLKQKGAVIDDRFTEMNPFLRGIVTRVLLGPVNVDLLRARDRHDQSTLRRRRKIRAFRTFVWVPAPEDLILLKMKAGRERDLPDCIGVFEAQKDRINLNYLWRWSFRLGLADEYHYIVGSGQE